MLKKKILILTILLCLIGFAIACEKKITDAKKDYDKEQNGKNSLVGEWYSVDYRVGETVITGEGIKVIFTNNTVTTFWSNYDDAVGFYDNTSYNIISENEIQLTGLNDDYGWSFNGKHITKFAFKSDTLFIEHFSPSTITVPYPHNVLPIYLIRKETLK